ncbi:hypothetical protein IFO69_15025 [Echinicola sp. CAU 1574]|uniref:Uncharacterized protein n=1 Tax=Echinicola arenosa TaxID=2774144 RepID=A0ABR9AQD4_9BACT|nr:hypothetical protein [Echinicola arenosa]MBD8490068.1 hypothetical protein [Echinicola arenosa]
MNHINPYPNYKPYTTWIHQAVVTLFVLVWTYTGLEKLMDYDGFRQLIMYQVITNQRECTLLFVIDTKSNKKAKPKIKLPPITQRRLAFLAASAHWEFMNTRF